MRPSARPASRTSDRARGTSSRLWDRRGITVSELAELAHVRKQTMAQAVEHLERAGYVERRPNPHDRRSRLVFLTERGQSVPPVTHAAAARIEEDWAARTGAKELETLRKSLQRLLTELSTRSP